MWSQIYSLLGKTFGFSRKESHGFMALVLLLLLAAVLPLLASLVLSQRADLSLLDQQTLNEQLSLLNNKGDSTQENEQRKAHEFNYALVEKAGSTQNNLHPFNPNLAGTEELQALGLSQEVAKRIENYRSKGGKFRAPEDLGKIYGITPALMNKLLPYIEITPNTTQKKPEITSTNINTADSSQWTNFRGIGPVLASRILKYREKLGGFISVTQLYEVYGLDSLKLEAIVSKMYVAESFSPKHINLNQCDIQTLASHPYISKKTAQIICNYRMQHGPFTTLEGLKDIKGLPEPTRIKILPYLRLN